MLKFLSLFLLPLFLILSGCNTSYETVDTTSLGGNSYVMEIYTVDNAFMKNVMEGTAIFFNSNSIVDILKTAVLISFLIMIFKGAIGGGRWDFGSFLIGIVLYALMFFPRVDSVMLINKYTGDTDIVNNIPIGVAFVGWATSSFGETLSESYKIAFSPPDMYEETKGGYLSPLRTLSVIKNLPIEGFERPDEMESNPQYYNLQKTIQNYIFDCVNKDIYELNSSGSVDMSFEKIYSAKDTWNAMKSNATGPGYMTTIYLDGSPNLNATAGSVVTCSDAWELIDYVVSDPDSFYYKKAKDYISKIANIGPSDIDPMVQDILGSQISAFKLAKNNLFIHHLQMSKITESSPGFSMASYIEYDSMSKRHVQSAGERALWEEAAVTLAAFIQALIFFAAPIMAILLMFGMVGISLIWKYVQLAIWVATWDVMMVIIDLYTYLAVQHKFKVARDSLSDPEDLISWKYISPIYVTADTWLSTAGSLAAATPALTYALLTGTSMALVAATNKIGSTKDTIRENAVTPDVAPGANQGSAKLGENSAVFNKNNGATSKYDLSSDSQGSIAISEALGHAQSSQSGSTDVFGNTKSSGNQTSATHGEAVNEAGSKTLSSGNEFSKSVTKANAKADSYTKGLSLSNQFSNSQAESVGSSASLGFKAKGLLQTAAFGAMGKDVIEGLSKLTGKDVEGVKNSQNVEELKQNLSKQIEAQDKIISSKDSSQAEKTRALIKKGNLAKLLVKAQDGVLSDADIQNLNAETQSSDLSDEQATETAAAINREGSLSSSEKDSFNKQVSIQQSALKSAKLSDNKALVKAVEGNLNRLSRAQNGAELKKAKQENMADTALALTGDKKVANAIRNAKSPEAAEKIFNSEMQAHGEKVNREFEESKKELNKAETTGTGVTEDDIEKYANVVDNLGDFLTFSPMMNASMAIPVAGLGLRTISMGLGLAAKSSAMGMRHFKKQLSSLLGSTKSVANKGHYVPASANTKPSVLNPNIGSSKPTFKKTPDHQKPASPPYAIGSPQARGNTQLNTKTTGGEKSNKSLISRILQGDGSVLKGATGKDKAILMSALGASAMLRGAGKMANGFNGSIDLSANYSNTISSSQSLTDNESLSNSETDTVTSANSSSNKQSHGHNYSKSGSISDGLTGTDSTQVGRSHTKGAYANNSRDQKAGRGFSHNITLGLTGMAGLISSQNYRGMMKNNMRQEYERAKQNAAFGDDDFAVKLIKKDMQKHLRQIDSLSDSQLRQQYVKDIKSNMAVATDQSSSIDEKREALNNIRDLASLSHHQSASELGEVASTMLDDLPEVGDEGVLSNAHANPSSDMIPRARTNKENAVATQAGNNIGGTNAQNLMNKNKKLSFTSPSNIDPDVVSNPESSRPQNLQGDFPKNNLNGSPLVKGLAKAGAGLGGISPVNRNLPGQSRPKTIVLDKKITEVPKSSGVPSNGGSTPQIGSGGGTPPSGSGAQASAVVREVEGTTTRVQAPIDSEGGQMLVDNLMQSGMSRDDAVVAAQNAISQEPEVEHRVEEITEEVSSPSEVLNSPGGQMLVNNFMQSGMTQEQARSAALSSLSQTSAPVQSSEGSSPFSAPKGNNVKLGSGAGIDSSGNLTNHGIPVMAHPSEVEFSSMTYETKGNVNIDESNAREVGTYAGGRVYAQKSGNETIFAVKTARGYERIAPIS